MEYTHECKAMARLQRGPYHGPAPIPQEGGWTQAKEVGDISGLTHGVGWCAPQQGACKLTLNIKGGVIEEALIETVGCTGMTHSAAMACEILPGKTILEALNTDLVCDAINVAMRELFLQIAYGRAQTAFSEGGLPIGAGLEDLGKGLRTVTGTTWGAREKGPRYLELAEGYVLAVLSSGAYTYSMASNYNRVARPAVALVGEGRAGLLAAREESEDLLRLDRVPQWLQ